MIITGDCRAVLSEHGPFDMIIADPPYGDTQLKWDEIVAGWEAVALSLLKPTGSMWVFGSMRYFMTTGVPKGFKLAQDVVWEKPSGSSFVADRFKRVHEHAVQLYRGDAPWKAVYNDVQRVPYTGPDTHPRRNRSRDGQHFGDIQPRGYDSDTRIVRSVIPAPQVKGGLHPTQKPVSLLELLIATSCPPGGLVGDFFAGSGSAGEACQTLGRRYVGAEIDPEMADKARARLAGNLFGLAA